jgi:hypothetical protein
VSELDSIESLHRSVVEEESVKQSSLQYEAEDSLSLQLREFNSTMHAELASAMKFLRGKKREQIKSIRATYATKS